jgi:undecaprenyl diphosphate synthase
MVFKWWFGCNNKNASKTDQFSLVNQNCLPKHIAIIMDGNGRWAKQRHLPRTFGHRAGVEALRGIVTAATKMGIGVLTVYAFSTENWKRPADEVGLLMSLFAEYLDSEINELYSTGVKIRFIGKTGQLAEELQHKMSDAENMTVANTGLILNIAVNYGGRAEILHAVQRIAQNVADKQLMPGEITESHISQNLYTRDVPDPDLLIRPSGDFRISNFLLWQTAYAELWFTPVNWPDFKPEHLIDAILDFQRRERRFGGLINAK